MKNEKCLMRIIIYHCSLLIFHFSFLISHSSLLISHFSFSMNICVFCSANAAIAPEYFTLTAELGRWAAEEGHTIVYGGVNQGLMEQVARAAHEAGGRTVGVVPSIVEQSGRTSQYVDELMTCSNLSDRKQLMLEASDVFVALPGGIGTLDEVFTIAASATIGYHHKRVILYNMDGFWNSLVDMLDDLQRRGMVRGQWSDNISVANSLDDIRRLLA